MRLRDDPTLLSEAGMSSGDERRGEIDTLVFSKSDDMHIQRPKGRSIYAFVFNSTA